MASSVSVLAPNGRRQTVKCTPNTTIMQIIEEVCKKQGYKPEDYDIKHHNKVLDTTSTFRFSGLPNNAQLELTDAVRARLDSEVTLAVNLENGNRVVGNFLPDTVLWDVLTKLCPNETVAGENVVIIYTRREIYGLDLHAIRLRDLGLRSGRAMMRLVHKSPAELKTQANISTPLPSKPAEEKPYHRTLKTEPTPSDACQLHGASTSTDANIPDHLGTKPILKRQDVDILKLAREKRKLDESPVKTAGADVESPKVKSKMEVEQVCEAMEIDSSVESSPKGQKLVDRPEVADDFIFIGERNAMLFSLESARAIPSEDLPDEFFDVTVEEARKILHDIRLSRHKLENGHLMTLAMRSNEEAKKVQRQLSKYKKSVIRVQFPDRTVLQGSFDSTEGVGDVVNFVREYLENKFASFYLYMTPPKQILSEEDKLIKIGCVPNALLHIGTSSGDKAEIRLKSDLRGKFTTNSVASLAASKVRKEFTHKDDQEQNELVEEHMDAVDLNAPGPSSQSQASPKKAAKSTDKVPKWFKTSK